MIPCGAVLVRYTPPATSKVPLIIADGPRTTFIRWTHSLSGQGTANLAQCESIHDLCRLTTDSTYAIAIRRSHGFGRIAVRVGWRLVTVNYAMISHEGSGMARFRYSLNSSTIKPTPILDKIRVAAEAGYGAIELWHDDIDRHLNEGGSLADIRKAVDDSGLAVPTSVMLKGWCEPDGPAYEAGLEECKRRMDQSITVGAMHAVAGPPHGAVDFDLAGQRYGELLDLGISMGVKPAMEYLGIAQEINNIGAALKIMENSGHPDATIVLDPFHDFRGGAGCEDIARLTASQVAVSHFDDAPATPPWNEQRDSDRVMPGDGIIDLTRFCELLTQIGYDGWISLELFREDLWQQDPLAVAQEGLEKMRTVCEG